MRRRKITLNAGRMLVAYSSKHGATAEIANWIGQALRSEGQTVDVKPVDGVQDLRFYGAFIVGGALYMGRWPRPARSFVKWLARESEGTPIWLFSSGPLDHSADSGGVPPTPGVARLMKKTNARGHATFGGYIDADTPGHMAHAIAQKSSGDFRNREQVGGWARGIAGELLSLGFGRDENASGRTA